ncbi:TIGR04104 family putative zinc finger protein [Allomuricauda sp. NBRC 101325]|uniref:TIGR04104 family putative zinc finger protein n=1 Tax=Allomuricauda sp. NBRC 101325 TaxID=1113758 RepID=UPI0024A4DC11|nr:TIGR04104 family putative zinc finger protein [Muricauda sp. NBRC 101325]GLU44373.1 hypothetical protein Musp01_19970 [Muricauda sp. NBRC 101325]
MQQCENCNRKFGFVQIFKSLWLAYKPIVCPQCNAVYEHTMKNRILTAFSVALGTTIGGLYWALSETDGDNKIFMLIISDVVLTLLFSSLSIYFFGFKRKQVEKTST